MARSNHNSLQREGIFPTQNQQSNVQQPRAKCGLPRPSSRGGADSGTLGGAGRRSSFGTSQPLPAQAPPGVDEDVRLGNGWVRRKGEGRFRWDPNSHIVVEATSPNAFVATYEDAKALEKMQGATWALAVEAKCVGQLSILFNYRYTRHAESYVSVVMNCAKKIWRVEACVQGKRILVGSAVDEALSASVFMNIYVGINGNKLTLVVDDHTFFGSLAIPQTEQITSPVGVAVAQSKATIKNWQTATSLQQLSVMVSGISAVANLSAGGSSQGPPPGGDTSLKSRSPDQARVKEAHRDSRTSEPTERKLSTFERRNKFTNYDADEFKSPLIAAKMEAAFRMGSQKPRASALGQMRAAPGGGPAHLTDFDGNIVKVDSKEANTQDMSLPAFQRLPPYNADDKMFVRAIEENILDNKQFVSFADVACLDDAKRLLKEAVIVPLLLPDFFTGLRQPWKGVLLHGPPGTGKTMLAKAVAGKANTTFFNVSSATLTSKWRGESEKLIRTLFNMARYYAPSIVFLDEIDSLLSKRNDDEHEASRRLKSEVFSQMDGVLANGNDGTQRVIVLATTNRPWDLDDAIRRRLEKRIYVPLPDKEARKEMFKLNLRNIRLDPEVDFDILADNTENFSGADVHLLCRDWAMEPMRRLIDGKSTEEILELKNSNELDFALSMSDFQISLKRISPSVDLGDLPKFEQWQKEFGSQ